MRSFFGKELIESEKGRAGVLLGFEEQYFWEDIAQSPASIRALDMLTESFRSANAYINIFDQGRGARDLELQNQADAAVANLRRFQEGQLRPREIFDLNRMATFLAVSELWQAHHSLLENNLRLYYNPVSGLLEPVGYDASPSPRCTSHRRCLQS